MKSLKVADIVKAVGGTLVRAGRKTVTGVSIDSRTCGRGDLFFAIKGERFDGHRFADDALGRGAAGAVVENPAGLKGRGVIVRVADTRRALADVARLHRSRLETRVIAVTGSNGKTTTRDMIAAILGTRYRVVNAPRNFNNDIGVPLTVFRLDTDTEFGVFEIEMNRFGGTKMLAEVCRPEVGVVTNVGDSHLEFMKDRRGVAIEKAELLAELPAHGYAVLNADDPLVMDIAQRAGPAKRLTFGVRRRADVFATDVNDRGFGGSEFRFQGQYRMDLPLPGLHNVANFLAAAAACRAVGMEFAEIPEGLAGFKPPAMRLRVLRFGRVTLIDDSYNANPQSMETAIDLLYRCAPKGHRVAFLGDMLELGSFTYEAHTRLGQLVGSQLDRVAFVGPMGQHVASVAVKSGMDAGRFRLYPDSDHVLAELFDIIKPGDTILVKGSRAMKMDLVTQAIVENYGKESDQAD